MYLLDYTVGSKILQCCGAGNCTQASRLWASQDTTSLPRDELFYPFFIF